MNIPFPLVATRRIRELLLLLLSSSCVHHAKAAPECPDIDLTIFSTGDCSLDSPASSLAKTDIFVATDTCEDFANQDVYANLGYYQAACLNVTEVESDITVRIDRAECPDADCDGNVTLPILQFCNQQSVYLGTHRLIRGECLSLSDSKSMQWPLATEPTTSPAPTISSSPTQAPFDQADHVCGVLLQKYTDADSCAMDTAVLTSTSPQSIPIIADGSCRASSDVGYYVALCAVADGSIVFDKIYCAKEDCTECADNDKDSDDGSSCTTQSFPLTNQVYGQGICYTHSCQTDDNASSIVAYLGIEGTCQYDTCQSFGDSSAFATRGIQIVWKIMLLSVPILGWLVLEAA